MVQRGVIIDDSPKPDTWQWTQAPGLPMELHPAEVSTWSIMTRLAGVESDAFQVSARQRGREFRAPSARLLASRQRAWVQPGPVRGDFYGGKRAVFVRESGRTVALQMQVDVLLVPGPDGHYVEYQVLPPINPTDQKEG